MAPITIFNWGTQQQWWEGGFDMLTLPLVGHEKTILLFFILLKNFISNHIFIYHWVMILHRRHFWKVFVVKMTLDIVTFSYYMYRKRLWIELIWQNSREMKHNFVNQPQIPNEDFVVWIVHDIFFFRKFIDKNIWSINLCLQE